MALIMKPADFLKKSFNLTKTYAELGNLTPVTFAARHGMVDYIQSKLALLSEKQVQTILAQTNSAGLTALHFSALYGQIESIQTLLNLGASPTAKSSLGHMPIHLIFNDKNDTDKMTQLFEIFKTNNEALVAKTNSKDNVAHLAAIKGQIGILKSIQIEAPNMFDSKNNQGMTPLHTAILNNQFTSLQYLYEHCDNQLTNSIGQNALHLAAKFSIPEVLEFLLPLYDVNQIDNEKHTALDLAILVNNTENINILNSHISCEQKEDNSGEYQTGL